MMVLQGGSFPVLLRNNNVAFSFLRCLYHFPPARGERGSHDGSARDPIPVLPRNNNAAFSFLVVIPVIFPCAESLATSSETSPTTSPFRLSPERESSFISKGRRV